VRRKSKWRRIAIIACRAYGGFRQLRRYVEKRLRTASAGNRRSGGGSVTASGADGAVLFCPPLRRKACVQEIEVAG